MTTASTLTGEQPGKLRLTPPPKSDTRYELPADGISLLGYVARRMHKTTCLLPVAGYVNAGQTAEALAQVALYAATASASYGAAHYQPASNLEGATVRQADPATGAPVTARLDSLAPHIRLSYTVEVPDGGRFTGAEAITGTTVSLRGLGMPAPSRFHFASADKAYTATLSGTITSELSLRLFAGTRIRAHGSLRLEDSAGNIGSLKLTRQGEIHIVINSAEGGARTWQGPLESAG